MAEKVQQSVIELRGVGPHLLSKLERLGIRSVQDILFHLPLRYQDRTRLTPIGGLQTGSEALIQGVIDVSGVRMGARRSLVTVVSDNTGRIAMRQFRFTTAQQRALQRGRPIQCYGEVRAGPSSLEMVHP